MDLNQINFIKYMENQRDKQLERIGTSVKWLSLHILIDSFISGVLWMYFAFGVYSHNISGDISIARLIWCATLASIFTMHAILRYIKIRMVFNEVTNHDEGDC